MLDHATILKKYLPLILATMRKFRVHSGHWEDCLSECKTELFYRASILSESKLHKTIFSHLSHAIVKFITVSETVHYGSSYTYHKYHDKKPITLLSMQYMYDDEEEIGGRYSMFEIWRNTKGDDDEMALLWNDISSFFSRDDLRLIGLVFSGVPCYGIKEVHRRSYVKRRKAGGHPVSYRSNISQNPKNILAIRRLAIKCFPKNKRYPIMGTVKLLESVRHNLVMKTLAILHKRTSYRFETEYNHKNSYRPHIRMVKHEA